MRFDRCAESYDANATPQRAFAERVAAFCAVPAGEHVVELGAGTGALTRFLCAAGAQVTATDISTAMIRRGRASVPSARWSVLDAFAEATPSTRVQVSSGLLQWAAEPVTTLRSWKSSLAAGGRMIHAFPCEPCLTEWRAIVRESPVHWRDEAAWRAVFGEAGLNARRVQVWRERALFPSALDLLRSLHQSGVTGQPRLGPGRLRQALRVYDALHRGPQGVAATWVWMAVEAGVS